MSNRYRVELLGFPLPFEVATHYGIRFLDTETGEEWQFNAYVFDRETGRMRSHGINNPDDRIVILNLPFTDRFGQPTTELMFETDSEAEFQQMLALASVAGNQINQKDIDYRLLDTNSNSAARTIAEILGFEIEYLVMPLPFDKQGNVVPGVTNILLDEDEMAALRYWAEENTVADLCKTISERVNAFACEHYERPINLANADVVPLATPAEELGRTDHRIP